MSKNPRSERLRALIWIKLSKKNSLDGFWTISLASLHWSDTLSTMRTKSARLFAPILVMTFDR